MYRKGVCALAEEKQFETRLKRALEKRGIYRLGSGEHHGAAGVWEKRVGTAFGQNGLPDLRVQVGMKNFEFELKASNGRASPLQEAIVRQINAAGGHAEIVYPQDFDRVIQKIEEALKK